MKILNEDDGMKIKNNDEVVNYPRKRADYSVRFAISGKMKMLKGRIGQ
jgi:hypothetical protein